MRKVHIGFGKCLPVVGALLLLCACDEKQERTNTVPDESKIIEEIFRGHRMDAYLSQESLDKARANNYRTLAFIIERYRIIKGLAADRDVDAAVRADGYSALMVAVEQGKEERVESLIEDGANPGLQVPSEEAGLTFLTPLRVAFLNGRTEIADMLISRYKVNCTADDWAICDKNTGKPVLFSAIDNRASYTLSHYLKGGADVNRCYTVGGTQTTLVQYVLQKKTYSLLHVLKEKGAKISTSDLDAVVESGMTPLLEAASRNDASDVLCLLKLGADATVTVQQGNPKAGMAVADMAVEKDNMEILEALAQKSVPISSDQLNAVDPKRGTTLFFRLMSQKKTSDMEKLIALGADPNMTDSTTGYTPLMQAVADNNVSMVEFLLKHGAEVNAAVPARRKKTAGVTALHIAANEGYLQIAKTLVEHGADVNAKFRFKDGSVNTPYSLARENNHPATAKFLKEKMK